MRYRKSYSLGVHELSQLLTAWNMFAENPKELGECVLGESYSGIVQELDKQCDIQLTPKQIYNLVWYYKHAVLERLKHNHKKLPPNYNKLLKRLQKQVPDLFTTDADGEVVMKESKEVLGDYDDAL